ncbi:MAG TPA: HDOD domain-containing protein [Telluria sp.]
MNAVSPEQLATGLGDLPSLPAVVMELLNSIDQEDVDIAVLARKVSHDQALTAKTLRLANSSAFGLQLKLTTIQQAITYLGFQTTRKLITTAALTGCFAENRCPGFDHKAFWRHSIATASCARVLARHLRVNQDYAFTAGLLHDVGRLVLVSAFPDKYARVLEHRKREDCTLVQAERAVIGADHTTAGAALARHWNFSETMTLPIALHHEPETRGAGSLATIVHVADAMVHALDVSGDKDEIAPAVSRYAWAALALNEETCLHVFRETELQFAGISELLLVG